jgi:BirA family biotin operon repressor/biotin-[acetyl-CoA-carboxylase] ligase
VKTLALLNPFGAPVFYRETVSSTMDESRRLAGSGSPHGTVIAAGFQERGRGRGRNRPWNMNRGESLPFTLLLRYPDFSAIPPALTLRTGLAVAEAVEDFAPLLLGKVRVKWPNDLMAAGPEGAFGKLAGILAEGDGRLVHIGCGVNVAQTGFPEELRGKAASLATVLSGAGGYSPESLAASRFALLERILLRLHGELEGCGEGKDWRARLEQRLFMKDRPVVFIAGGPDSPLKVEGRLLGIGPDGEILIVPQGESRAHSFVTGELRVDSCRGVGLAPSV